MVIKCRATGMRQLFRLCFMPDTSSWWFVDTNEIFRCWAWFCCTPIGLVVGVGTEWVKSSSNYTRRAICISARSRAHAPRFITKHTFANWIFRKHKTHTRKINSFAWWNARASHTRSSAAIRSRPTLPLRPGLDAHTSIRPRLGVSPACLPLRTSCNERARIFYAHL